MKLKIRERKEWLAFPKEDRVGSRFQFATVGCTSVMDVTAERVPIGNRRCRGAMEEREGPEFAGRVSAIASRLGYGLRVFFDDALFPYMAASARASRSCIVSPGWNSAIPIEASTLNFRAVGLR